MTDHIPDPKEFYDKVMPGKLGGDYETARWGATPLRSAQYDMTAQTIREYVLPALKGAKRVLEVGPGPGTWTKLLLAANPGADYTLVDISSEMLAQARGNLADRANITFVESDLLAFELLQPFDFFFSSRAIEYMPDRTAAVAAVAALLSPGAYGALITKTPKYFFDRLRGRRVADLHRSQVTPRELMKALRAAGFEVIGVHAATATVPGAGSASLNRIAFRMIRRLPLFFPLSLFTESYCVVFKKL